MVKLPDRWTAYSNCGRRIDGTRLVSFKTPLKDNYFNDKYSVGHRWGVRELLRTIPNLGLVIDLTYSTKYYYPEDLLSHGINHVKILCEGHVIPRPSVVKQFIDTIDAFLDANKHNDKLIGVHCTHGLNRTGYLVCRYMIERLQFDPESAIRDKIIGVHCTHGINRTGYIICRYLIDRMHLDPVNAINAFNDARGHRLERRNYIEHLKNRR